MTTLGQINNIYFYLHSWEKKYIYIYTHIYIYIYIYIYTAVCRR